MKQSSGLLWRGTQVRAVIGFRCEDGALLPGLSFGSTQYLNWEVLANRAVLQRQSWNPRAGLLVMDEIHKMPNWNEKC